MERVADSIKLFGVHGTFDHLFWCARPIIVVRYIYTQNNPFDPLKKVSPFKNFSKVLDRLQKFYKFESVR